MMKHFILCVSLSALSLSALAQTPQATETVTINSPAMSIDAPEKILRLSGADFHEFKGVYSLSNGQHLALYQIGSFQFAQVEDQSRHQIVATTNGNFIALDRQLKLRLEIMPNGDASGELLMRVPTKAQANMSTDKKNFVLVSLR
jgi:hypothetical protein